MHRRVLNSVDSPEHRCLNRQRRACWRSSFRQLPQLAVAVDGRSLNVLSLRVAVRACGRPWSITRHFGLIRTYRLRMSEAYENAQCESVALGCLAMSHDFAVGLCRTL